MTSRHAAAALTAAALTLLTGCGLTAPTTGDSCNPQVDNITENRHGVALKCVADIPPGGMPSEEVARLTEGTWYQTD